MQVDATQGVAQSQLVLYIVKKQMKKYNNTFEKMANTKCMKTCEATLT